MNVMICSRRASLTLALCVPVLFIGCGGSSSSGTPTPTPPPTVSLSGVAAVGAPIAGATVTVIDASTSTANPASVTTNANGAYTIDITGLQAPLSIQVVGSVAGVPQNLVSVLVSVAAGANTANVTPLTNAIAALIAPGGNPSALLTPATLASAATTTSVNNAVTLIAGTLGSDPGLAALIGTNFNPITTAFVANGTGIDAALERLQVDISAQGVNIANLAAPVGEQGTPAPILLTAAQVTNPPPTPPTLPASAAATDLPGAADIESIRAKLQACLALPLNQRVTFDVSGLTVTAVSPTCTFGDPGFRSSGRNWVEQLGQFSFSKAQVNNAAFGKGAVVLALAAQNLTDPKEFKHPQCNTGPCAVVRYPATYTGGFIDTWDFVFGKVGGVWALVGNQRPYDLFVQPRLRRYIAANTAPNATDSYFFKGRFETQIRLGFSPIGRNGNLVRAVRMKGPGLPVTGVVLHRSNVCGTDDRFAITYQTGVLRRPSDNAVVTFNFAGSNDFKVDAANLDGTALAMPVPVFNATTQTNQTYSPTAIAGLASLAPAWTRYTAEIFLFSNTTTPDVPDEIVYVRTDAAAANANEGVNRSWPTLSPTYVTAYLTPTGSGAGSLTGPLTMDWTSPAGVTVLSSYLFSQNFVSATNVNGITTTYGKRTRLDFEPSTYGDTSAPSTLLASIVPGASLAPQTANASPNPNPRCADNAVVPLTTITSDYRESGLAFRLPDRQRMDSIWFWDN
jgi:hypothetical protein